MFLAPGSLSLLEVLCAVMGCCLSPNACSLLFSPDLDGERCAAHLQNVPVSADTVVAAEAVIIMRVVNPVTIKLGFFLDAPRPFSP